MGPAKHTQRVPRRAWATSPAFRWIVPVALWGMALLAAGIAVLAAAVLLGWLPYPGR